MSFYWALNTTSWNTTGATSNIKDRAFQPKTLEIVVVILISFVSLVGNHFILFAFVNNVKMRTVTNTMVVNMCVADALTVLGDFVFYVVPSWIHPQLVKQYTFCRVAVFMCNFLTVATRFSMLCTAVDRYLNLVQNSLCRRLSRKKSKILIGCFWSQALVAALPWDLLTQATRIPDLELFVCQRLPYTYSPGLNIPGLSIVLKILCVVLPYLIIVNVFGQILMFARNRRKVRVHDSNAICRSKTERFAIHSYVRSTVTAVLLFAIYLISETPFIISVIYTLFEERSILPSAFGFTVFYFQRLKGAVLPFMYLTRNRNVFLYFRRKVEYWCGNKDHSNHRPTTSFLLHRTKSGNLYGTGITGRRPCRLGTLTKRYFQSQSMKQNGSCRVFYTEEARRKLQKSFTDLSSVQDEDEKSSVVIERWSKKVTVKESKITATEDTTSTINTQKPLKLGMASLYKTAKKSGI